VEALWIEHKLRFTYFGRTTYYSCEGLRSKVTYLLKKTGVRPDDLKVMITCFDATGPQYMPGVRIHATVPTPVTPELLARLADEAPKRELIARVRGKGEGMDEATARFPATWNTIDIDGRRDRRIEGGDCELLDQMIDHVFAPLGVRLAPDSRLSCTPNQVHIRSVKVKLHALLPVPPPDAVPQLPTAAPVDPAT